MKLPFSSRTTSGASALSLLATGVLLLTAPPAAQAQTRNAGLAPAGERDLSGTWWITDYSRTSSPQNTTAIPFTAAGKAAYDKNLASAAAGQLVDPGRSKCLPEGLPRTLFAPYPMQIVEHGTWLTFVHEINHIFWSAQLNGAHPGADDLDPTFMGDSTARWDGATLVVDSIGFKDSFLDDSALPHGPKLHVVTRIRRLDDRNLDIAATIEDPDFFTAPFTIHHSFERRSDVAIQDYICGEPHRVLTGSRGDGVQLNWEAKR